MGNNGRLQLYSQSGGYSGKQGHYSQIKDFRECVDHSGLKELKSSGYSYTWINKQEGQNRVLSKNYRVFINADWVNSLPAYEVHYMPAGLYDHSLAFIKWEVTSPPMNKSFRY